MGLQPAADPAAAASLLLVLPHSEDGVSSHLQREGEPVTAPNVTSLHHPNINVTFDLVFLSTCSPTTSQVGKWNPLHVSLLKLELVQHPTCLASVNDTSDCLHPAGV